MRGFFKEENSIVIFLRIGVIVLMLCLLVSFYHVYDIKHIFTSQAESSLDGHFISAISKMNEEVSEMEELLKDTYKDLPEEMDPNQMRQFLRGKAPLTEDYIIYVVRPNTNQIFTSLGIVYNNDLYSHLDTISPYKYKNNFTCKTGFDFSIVPNTQSLVGIFRFKNGDSEQYSYMMIYKPLKLIVDSASFQYLNEIAAGAVTNNNGNLLYASEAFGSVYGEQDIIFNALIWYSNGYKITVDKLADERERLGAREKDEFSIKNENGKEVLVKYQQIENTDGVYYFVCYNEDMIVETVAPAARRGLFVCLTLCVVLFAATFYVWTIMRASNETFTKLAFVDEVTGGYNFNYFRRKVPDIIRQNSEMRFVIIRFDILYFRFINEAYGHEKADKVLTAVIEEFKKIYTNKEVCIRINSDQFLALVINDIDLETTYQKFNQAVEERAKDVGVRYPIRLKTGIYQIRKGDRDVDVMIDHANAARKLVNVDENIMEVVFSEQINEYMLKVDMIESQMQASLSKGEFKVFLQPKWNLREDHIMGAEALCRWQKEDGTTFQPGEFIPIFEKNGFIEKLDFYMLESVCREVSKIENEGLYGMYPISVNQSRVLINNPDYIRNVEKIMDKYPLSKKYIQIEVTETVFFDEKEKMVDVINKLKAMGITIAMDDFGSGYSSLNILKDIPFDAMKIDKEFFSESSTSETSIIILKKIIEMAKALQIEVICEGVESYDQIVLLRNAGCDGVQGYYYGKPIVLNEYMERYCKK